MSYEPQPIDTTHVTLSAEIHQLTERLAENAHEHWARQRLSEGWTYGPTRDDVKKEHPCLVPYAVLPGAEKQYDRLTAMETLKTVIALGYRLEPPGQHAAPASQGRRPTFPATTGDAITLGQCLSPGLDHHSGGAAQSLPPPAGPLRSRALAAACSL